MWWSRPAPATTSGWSCGMMYISGSAGPDHRMQRKDLQAVDDAADRRADVEPVELSLQRELLLGQLDLLVLDVAQLGHRLLAPLGGQLQDRDVVLGRRSAASRRSAPSAGPPGPAGSPPAAPGPARAAGLGEALVSAASSGRPAPGDQLRSAVDGGELRPESRRSGCRSACSARCSRSDLLPQRLQPGPEQRAARPAISCAIRDSPGPVLHLRARRSPLSRPSRSASSRAGGRRGPASWPSTMASSRLRCGAVEPDQHLAGLHRVAVLDEDLADHAAVGMLDHLAVGFAPRPGRAPRRRPRSARSPPRSRSRRPAPPPPAGRPRAAGRAPVRPAAGASCRPAAAAPAAAGRAAAAGPVSRRASCAVVAGGMACDELHAVLPPRRIARAPAGVLHERLDNLVARAGGRHRAVLHHHQEIAFGDGRGPVGHDDHRLAGRLELRAPRGSAPRSPRRRAPSSARPGSAAPGRRRARGPGRCAGAGRPKAGRRCRRSCVS